MPKLLTLFRMRDGAGAKRPPPIKGLLTSFSPVTFTNVGINPFCHIAVIFQVCTYCQSQIIELDPRPLLKKFGFSGQILIKFTL